MKIIQSNKDVQSVKIIGTDGETLSIWLPTNLEVVFEGIELHEEENDMQCEVSIHCKAKIDNINIIQEAL
jgi:hypothetical protein